MSTLSISDIGPDEISYQFTHWADNNGYTVTVTTSIFFPLALLFVVLRLIARKSKRLSWQADDYLIIVAMIFAAGLWAEALLAVRYGAGQHSLKAIGSHGIQALVRELQIIFAVEITYSLAHFAVKASILMLYRSIFTLNKKSFKQAWYLTFGYVVVVAIISVIVVCTQCQPISFSWEEPLGAKGSCVNLRGMILGNGILVTVADLALLIIPMPMLWSLQIARKRKIMLCMLFSLGLFVMIASIVRISFLVRVASSIDLTFIEVDPLIWSLIEVDLGIICACLPNLRPLFVREKKNTTGAGTAYKRFKANYNPYKSSTNSDGSPSHPFDASKGKMGGQVDSIITNPKSAEYVEARADSDIDLEMEKASV